MSPSFVSVLCVDHSISLHAPCFMFLCLLSPSPSSTLATNHDKNIIPFAFHHLAHSEHRHTLLLSPFPLISSIIYVQPRTYFHPTSAVPCSFSLFSLVSWSHFRVIGPADRSFLVSRLPLFVTSSVVYPSRSLRPHFPAKPHGQVKQADIRIPAPRQPWSWHPVVDTFPLSSQGFFCVAFLSLSSCT